MYVALIKIKQMINKKSNRTLGYTINHCLESKRMEIAASNFKEDPMFMKALLTELSLEVFNVTRSFMVKRYNMHSTMDAFELAPLLRSTDVDDLNTFNIYFNLSPLEQKLYVADPKGKLTDEERSELLSKLKKEYMGD